MERIEYRNIVCSDGWPAGEWDNEPDKVQWQDEATGLPCLIVRNGAGAWCGYVGVTEGHPAFGKDYDDENINVDVHGGLTFAAPCQENDKEHGICHIPSPGEPDHVWWLGFDCLHAGDYGPATRPIHGLNRPEVYRNMGYVTEQCVILAAQLKEMTK